MALSVNAWAIAEDESVNNTCPPGHIILNTAIDATVDVPGAILDTDYDYNDYYTLTFTASGVLDISAPSNRNLYLAIGNSCNDSTIYNGNNKSKTHSETGIPITASLVTPMTVFVKVYVTNSVNNKKRTYTLNASFVADVLPTTSPVAVDDIASTDRLTAVDIDVLSNDSDDNGDGAIDPSTVTITSPPANGTTSINTSTGVVTYTPNSPFDPADLGDDTFKYTVNDINNGTSNEATVTVTVTTANNPPVANDKTFKTSATTPISGNVITGVGATSPSTPDSDPDSDPLTVDSYILYDTGYGTLSITAPGGDGNFTFTPNGTEDVNVTFSYIINDGYGGTAEANITINILPEEADLSIEKSGPATANINAAFSYTLTAYNLPTSLSAAQNVVITDTLPAGMSYAGYTASSGWTCTFSSATVSCSTLTLPVGSGGNIIINGFAPGTPGVIVNTVSIASDTSDPDMSNNDDNVTTSVLDTSADLVIAKTASPNPVITASPLDYTISVRNDGPNDSSGIRVTDSLDSDLHFVSINAGTDWSCSQGQLIICDYTANGGILATGTSASDITFRVTSPIVAGSVDNTATVSSTIFDPDTSNNTDTIPVTVNEGTNVGSNFPLQKYLQYNLYGDMRLIGNANVNFSGTDPNENYNDNVDMRYVDTDGIGSTYNSSSSTLVLADPSYEIIWAGLYWEGHICSDESDGTGNGSGTGCDWSHSAYSSFNQGSDNDNLASVKLKTPSSGSSYIDITANNLNVIQRDATNWTYSAFADITNLVGQYDTGTYTVADIVLTEGEVGNGGNYGGWAILTIYRDPSTGLNFKNISVFKGFQYISSDGNAIDIDGFLTPLSGPITASIAFFAADGDPVSGGVGRMRVGNSGTYAAVPAPPVVDAANPPTNLFNSSIAEFGVPINSGVPKTYGVDADRVDVSNFMVNDQQDTRFLFDVSTPTGGVDHYSVTMFAFATDLTTPNIKDLNKSATIVDINGTLVPAGPGTPIYPGSEIIYTLEFQNIGDEIAELFEIYDDLDDDGLSPALELDNFDASRIKLSQPNSASWQSNPDCGYSSSEHKVWCKIPEVQIGDKYTMEFSVRVKYDLRGFEDENATNTAYANYKNATTGEFVVLVSNSSGNYGGISNTFNAGVFTIPPNWTYVASGMDAINWDYPYDADKNITTKIVNKPFNLKLVYLDSTGQPTDFYSTRGFNMPVILTLNGSPGTKLVPDGVVLPEFTNGESEIIAYDLNLEEALEGDWIKMGFVNMNNLDWDSSGINCAQTSTTGGNLKGVPQCLSSGSNVAKLFPEGEFPFVHDVCLGGNTLIVPANKDAACDPQAYNNSGSKGDIVPDIYNNAYGCLQCLTDSNATFNSRSTDDFSARPKEFIMTSSGTHYPDLLRSALDYNLTIVANDYLDSQTINYDQSKSNLDVNHTLLFSDGSIDSSGLLDGNASFVAGDFNLTDGISVALGTISNEVVGFTFNDVGRLIIKISDPHWTNDTDYDDTPQDCNSTQWTIADGTTRNIDASAYVCGEVNVRFIPDHFDVTGISLNNHAQSPLTYISNDKNMSAHVGVTLSAMNALGGITRNFRQGSGFYENPVNVVLQVTDWNASIPVPVSGSGSRHPLGNAVHLKDIPTPLTLGFGGLDANGTHSIAWNDSNATQKIMFNYVRAMNVTVNPFDVPGTDINITTLSTYTGLAGSAAITGDGIGVDQNATFYYARTRPSLFFYDDVETSSIKTPIAIDIFCSLGITACGALGIDTVNAQINDPEWWLSLNHQMSRNDGNITLVKGSITEGPSGSSWTISPTTVTVANGIDNNITVSNTSGNTPLKVEIELVSHSPANTQTNSWMIYNPNDSILQPMPLYKVRFIGPSSWTGVGQTGNVVDTGISTKKSNRLDW